MSSWEPFEEPDLFGSLLDPPVKIMRGAIDNYDAESLGAYLGVKQLEAIMGGNVYKVPRLEAWYGHQPYSFGGRTVQPRDPEDAGDCLLKIKARVEALTGERFDSCFVNLYRDEKDHIPWHADDDSWIGPVIASVSIGATRRFWLRRKSDHQAVVQGEMRDGDIVLMGAGCQDAWEHKVPKHGTPRGVRLNLTFRQTRA